MLLENKYCPVEDGVKLAVRRRFNIESPERDVAILREWIKQQKHLPQDTQDDDFLELVLLKAKFRIEQAKTKLEGYYTLRRIPAQIFLGIPSSLPSQVAELILPLPDLNDKLERIVIVKLLDNASLEDDDVMRFLKYLMCASEYSMRCDYSAGLRIVQDFAGMTVRHLHKYSAKFAMYATIYQEAYFALVAGIEYINVPPLLDLFMQTTKVLLKPKIFKKITIHKSLESLHANINKAYLPLEYGGDKMALSEFLKNWDEEFKSNEANFNKILKEEVANEDLRVGDVKFNETFGVNGTFKSLNLD